MASRKDKQGRVLQKGEAQRKDGRYHFAYTDITGKRCYIYASNLVDLRKKEREFYIADWQGATRFGTQVTLNFVEGILTTTKGEVIPIEKIQDIDALMDSAGTISLKKYGNMYDSEIVAAVYTNPPEEYDGQVRIYLWKETGAKKGDNIYVMYRNTDFTYRRMAAVVDRDGTVRFTLEDALAGTEFVLVRVNIESTQLPS